MDLMALLRYVFDHNQQVIGGLMVIILATAALLAMRMVAQEKSTATGPATGKSGASDLDLGAIESAFKRVLAAQGGVAVANEAAPSAAAPAVDVSERDAKIQELAREIDRLTAELNSKSDGAGFGGTKATAGGAVDNAQIEKLQSKIAELEGKLTEYEIIEDDIADLSRYKDENAALKSELQTLKERAGGAGASAEAPVAPTPAAPESAPASASVSEEVSAAAPAPVESPEAALPEHDDELAALEAELAAASGGLSAEEAPVEAQPDMSDAEAAAAAILAEASPAAAPAKAELDEAMMKEFASAVDVQKPEVAASSDLNMAVAAASLGDGSSVLDDSVDTEKMLEEVSSLAHSTDTAEDVLAASLDTDKLLAEVGSLMPHTAPEAPSAPAQAAPAAPAAQAPAPAAAPPPVMPAQAEPDANFEDDLLAEFKDSNDGGQG